jgi:hypothetical protein
MAAMARRMSALCGALAIVLATALASAEPGSTSCVLVEVAGSLGMEESPSGFEAPGGVETSVGGGLQAAGALGVGFAPSVVTRLRYEHGTVGLAALGDTGVTPHGLNDYRVEVAWRPGEGWWQPYLGVGVGYRRIDTLTGGVEAGLQPDFFRLTPQGGIAGFTVGFLVRDLSHRSYALLAASFDASALHSQDAHRLPNVSREFDYVVTPTVQTWFSVRLEFGFDFVLSGTKP